jgi:hypothetical protein
MPWEARIARPYSERFPQSSQSGGEETIPPSVTSDLSSSPYAMPSVFTEQELTEFYSKWVISDFDFIRTCVADTAVVKMPGRPPVQGIEAMIDMNRSLFTVLNESIQIEKFLTDGKSTIAALCIVTLQFKTAMPEFMGVVDLKVGDKIIAWAGGFVLFQLI